MIWSSLLEMFIYLVQVLNGGELNLKKDVFVCKVITVRGQRVKAVEGQ